INNAIFQILREERKTPDYNWFRKEYLKAHLKNVKLNKFAKVVLNCIKTRKIHLGLISDVDDWYLYKQLVSLGIFKLFDSITTSEEVGVRKPSEKIFKIALKKARCKPKNAIYVGDSIERDILGAKAVGMIPIFFSNNLNSSAAKSSTIKIYSATESKSVKIFTSSSMLQSINSLSELRNIISKLSSDR
ncbi:MAG: HAD-IA family hydrolase, partial [Candidatus Thermoplasmatota archaeon]